MYRVDHPSASLTLPAATAVGSTVGYFQPGDPSLGIIGTVLTVDWANTVQEELISVVTAGGLTLSKTTRNQLLTALNAMFMTRSMFVGMSFEWNGTTLPSGFLWEDGSNISRTTYALLYGKIGTAHGVGNGTTTFGLPDSRGRVAVGRDDMGGTAASRVTTAISGVAGNTLGAVGGDQRLQSHGHAVNDPTHTHGVYDPSHAHGYNKPYAAVGFADGSTPGWYGAESAAGTGAAVTGISIYASATGISIQTGGTGSSQNMMPAIIKNKIIYAGV